MAARGSKRRGGRADATAISTPRRSARANAAKRSATAQEEPTADVFDEMLEQADDATEDAASERPLKRRKVKPLAKIEEPEMIDFGTQVQDLNSDNKSESENGSGDDEFEDVLNRPVQTVYDDSEDSEHSEPDWENVDLLGHETDASLTAEEADEGDMVISLDNAKNLPTTPKKMRKPGLSAADRKRRLEIHKLHILCLLYHVHLRNVWCNDKVIQTSLRPLLPPKLINQLLPSPEVSQFQAARSFIDGLNGVKALWKERFRVNLHGMRKPFWAEDESSLAKMAARENFDPALTREGFRKLTTAMNGSQDSGAQLFCALLRSIGVEARLVCSLQCLPFNASTPTFSPGSAESRRAVYLDTATNTITATRPRSPPKTSPAAKATPTRIKRMGGGRRRGGSSSAPDKGSAPKITAIPHIRPTIAPQYPVFWVEAFNAAHQKWVAVDPLATFTVDRPFKLEPPLNSNSNSMTYVIAFEEDGVARDVTRRYAKAFNAKTRKNRVESTANGQAWLLKALKPFKRGRRLDRDQIEEAALGRQEAAEGLPRNVQDFKDHPIYVLERHLRHNEVIYPKHEVGKATIGPQSSDKTESVFRRRDVHIVRSGDKWYRLGREVKLGEQPLKYAKPRKTRAGSPGFENDAEAEQAGVALYAGFQTELYVPPPVSRGRIPKNAFGNLDVYVPSMVPAGGSHIRHPDASKAARVAGVDFADAVTGFSFKGRVGTAVVQGCVVATEYREAVQAIIDGMQYAADEAEMTSRNVKALRMWKHFVVGLRIVERVKEYASDDEGAVQQTREHDEDILRAIKDAVDVRAADSPKDDVEEMDYDEGGGGFFPGEHADAPAPLPTARQFNSYNHHVHSTQPISAQADEDDFGGGFLPEAEDPNLDDDLPIRTDKPSTQTNGNHQLVADLPDDTSDLGGGFVSEDMDVEETTNATHSQTSLPVADPRSEAAANIEMSGALIDTNHTAAPNEAVTPSKASVTSPIAAFPNANEVSAPVAPEPTSTTPTATRTTSDEQPTPKPATLQREESNQSDHSLLSHDPDDEDADPEWLL